MIFRPRRLLIRGTSAVLRGLCHVCGGFSMQGLEHIPETGPAIIASNHLSWADPPALRAVLKRTTWFMANDFLLRIPVLGWLLPWYGAFPVRRGVLDREALRRTERHLGEGDLVVIFPEGGTTLTGRLVPFEGGVAMLSLRNQVPIIPAGITGTDRVLPSRAPWPHYARGGVSVTFGPPIHPGDVDPLLPRRQRVELLTQRLHESVAALLPPEYLPEPQPAQA